MTGQWERPEKERILVCYDKVYAVAWGTLESEHRKHPDDPIELIPINEDFTRFKVVRVILEPEEPDGRMSEVP